MVTEGYIRVPPPPPTVGVSTLARRFARRLPCNLQCILRVGFKNIVFYSVSWPLGGHGFYLGGVQKPWFLRGFGLQGGEKIGKVGILKVLQHRWPKKRPS